MGPNVAAVELRLIDSIEHDRDYHDPGPQRCLVRRPQDVAPVVHRRGGRAGWTGGWRGRAGPPACRAGRRRAAWSPTVRAGRRARRAAADRSVGTTPGSRCWCRSTGRAAGSGWPWESASGRLPEPPPSTMRYPPCGSPVGSSAMSRRGVHRLSSCIHRSGCASGSKPSLAYTPWASLVASRMRCTPNSATWSRTAPVSQVPSPRPRAAGSM